MEIILQGPRGPKNLLLLYLPAILLCLSLNLSAAADESSPSNTPPYTFSGKKIMPNPRIVWADSSEALREGRNYISLIGLGLITSSLNFGHYYRPDLILMGSYIRQLDFIDGSSHSLSFGIRQFFENSFYLNSAIAIRNTKLSRYNNTVNRGRSLNYTDFGLDLSIGNQWQWPQFTLSCEWFGIYLPPDKWIKDNREIQFRLTLISMGISY